MPRQLWKPSLAAISVPARWRCRPIPTRTAISSAAGCSARWISAAGIFASKMAKSRTVTVAIEAMNFRKPVFVGDLVSVHANLVRIGRTSVTVHLEAWVLRRKEMHSILVTDGNFTYVSIDDSGHPQAIKQDEAPISA